MAADRASPRSSAFGALLRRHRIAANLTQDGLADLAKLSERTISDLERGVKHRPHRATVRLLAEALELSAEQAAHFEAAVVRVRGSSKQLAATGVTQIPAPPNAFIGRLREIREVRELFAKDRARLVTLTGPGGVGKTRLALEVAGGLRTGFADGAIFVPLAPVRDPELVGPAIAKSTGIREVGDEPLINLLCSHFRDKDLLLLLDNFEHVLDAGPLVSLLL
ncbi:MAG: helix-turn-helix domain-containing protein, partial [Chloroflexota bacterium]